MKEKEHKKCTLGHSDVCSFAYACQEVKYESGVGDGNEHRLLAEARPIGEEVA